MRAEHRQCVRLTGETPVLLADMIVLTQDTAGAGRFRTGTSTGWAPSEISRPAQ